MAWVAEQSLITEGEKGGCGSPFFNGECALRPEKTFVVTAHARHWDTVTWRSGLMIPISVYARKWLIRALYLRAC
jgi:hypothetical protein